MNKLNVLKRMITLVKPLYKHMILAILCGTCAYLTVQFIPVLGGYAVLLKMGYKVPFTYHTICILLIIFAIARSVLRYIEQKTGHYIAFTLLAIVRDKVFKALRRLSPAKLDGRDKGDLISLITSDVELLEVFYAHTISPLAIAILTELVMVIYIGHFHILLGLFALCVYLTVGIALPLLVSHISGHTGDMIRKQAGSLSSFLLESIRGISETLQYQWGEKRMAEMNKRQEELGDMQGKMNKLSGYDLSISNTMILVFDIMMVFLSIYLYMNKSLTMPGMILSMIAFMSSFGPVMALADLGTGLQATVAAGSRILAILDEEPETEDITGKEDITFKDITVDHVSFSYDKEKVVDDLTISFPTNKIIGIIGKSGSGKSTLLKLMMRFWNVDEGVIKISDKSLDEINTSNLREMESYMTQETYLFKDTIKNNVKIAKLDATDEEVQEACRKASLHDWIMTLPDQYETQVGELGDTLSGGEAQRIGLARAFLHGAKLILLDEPTSNLDSLNEAVILKSLKEETDDQTIVLVSHRESTVRIADEIYTLDR